MEPNENELEQELEKDLKRARTRGILHLVFMGASFFFLMLSLATGFTDIVTYLSIMGILGSVGSLIAAGMRRDEKLERPPTPKTPLELALAKRDQVVWVYYRLLDGFHFVYMRMDDGDVEKVRMKKRKVSGYPAAKVSPRGFRLHGRARKDLSPGSREV